MSLDVFNPIASDQNVAQNAAHDLPAGFTEAFDISLRGIGEWNSSTAYSNARQRALATYYDDVKRQTGVQLPLYGMGGNVSIDDLNEGIAKLPQAPDQAPMPPLSEDSINSMALARMARAHQDSRAFESRETTWGGTAGTVIGTLTASLADPVAAATLPLGGAGTVPIAVRALEFAAIGAGTEGAIAASNYQARETAVPGSSKEIPGEIASAWLFGGVLGGAMGALEKVIAHGVRRLPTTVRDEVNAASSELQFHATNPFPTAAGETAARDAMVDATMAMIRDLPVRSADNFAASHVADYALAAKVTTPEELAVAGERHLRPGTFDEVPNVERFDRMPSAHDDTASYWESRLAGASPDERAALGATDDLASSSRSASGLTLEHAEDIPFPAIPGVRDESFARRFNINDADGNKIGVVDIQAKENGKALEIVHIGTEEGSANRLDLGPRGVREVLNQVRDQYPEAETLTGYRISGAHKGDTKDVVFPLRPRDRVPARDLTPEQTAQLVAEPATQDAVLHNLDHIVAANPEAEFTTQVRQTDGTYQFQTQKLADVMKEIGEFESAARELEACVIGLEAAE